MTNFEGEWAVSKGFRGVMASALLATTALGTGAIVAPGAAHAQAAQSYDLPAGPLAVSLNRFAEASNIKLFYDSTLTNGRSSPAIKGSFSAPEALSRLLAGSIFDVTRIDDPICRFATDNKHVYGVEGGDKPGQWSGGDLLSAAV